MNHLPIIMGIRGAYAIRPYTGTLKMDCDGIRSILDRPIRGTYARSPYTDTLKMGWDRIRSTPDGTVRGAYAIRPQTASGDLAFSSLVLLCRQVNVGIA